MIFVGYVRVFSAKEILDVLLNPSSYLDKIVDGSAEDELSNKFKNEINQVDEDRYQQALISTRVTSIVNNAPIRIPAFIVPLEFDDEQKVIQFFMVPYYGACIHLPPPPPNQTIFVNYAKGVKLESLYDPYWVSGIIKTSLVENDGNGSILLESPKAPQSTSLVLSGINVFQNIWRCSFNGT